MTTPSEILDFWYNPPMSEHWFSSTPAIDADILARYGACWERAAAGEFDTWRYTAEGCLALCIVLDQFPLNMFRGQARSFSTEQKAVAITKHAVMQGFDALIPRERVSFLYMPLMHSEDLYDQDESVRLFEAVGLAFNAQFARHHREIVRRFGRFPHRNALLGRVSTDDEMAYLNSQEAFTG